MRILIQRVQQASVSIGGTVRSQIGAGLLVLLGVGTDDTDADIEYLAGKLVRLRIFDDEAGVMNRDVVQAGGEVLVVSQFTLMASTRKGNRPSYIHAAPEAVSRPLYERFVARVAELLGREVPTGEFGADMQVGLVNDGPVTSWIDSSAAKPIQV
ncbi:MAG: D-tyrosyl-tRNA(Tyr) deacylase [Alistipes sp.]|nr:D-tyrosyl-tRNA(Tyr) deacylase [Alistipes sp.]